MKKYGILEQIQVLNAKQLIIEAENEEQAIKMFLENKEAAESITKNQGYQISVQEIVEKPKR